MSIADGSGDNRPRRDDRDDARGRNDKPARRYDDRGGDKRRDDRGRTGSTRDDRGRPERGRDDRGGSGRVGSGWSDRPRTDRKPSGPRSGDEGRRDDRPRRDDRGSSGGWQARNKDDRPARPDRYGSDRPTRGAGVRSGGDDDRRPSRSDDRPGTGRYDRDSRPASSGYRRDDRDSRPASSGYRRDDRDSRPASSGYRRDDRDSRPAQSGYRRDDRGSTGSDDRRGGYRGSSGGYDRPRSGDDRGRSGARFERDASSDRPSNGYRRDDRSTSGEGRPADRRPARDDRGGHGDRSSSGSGRGGYDRTTRDSRGETRGGYRRDDRSDDRGGYRRDDRDSGASGRTENRSTSRDDRPSAGVRRDDRRPADRDRSSYRRPDRQDDRPARGDRPERRDDRAGYRRDDRGGTGRVDRRPDDRSTPSRERTDQDRPASDPGTRDDRRQGDRPTYRVWDDRPRGDRAGGHRSGSRDQRPPRRDDTDAPRIPEPALTDDVVAADLDAAARRDLRGLQKDTADTVARHLVAAGSLVDEDPALALEHARYARQRASRIAVVREAAGIAAYHAGEWSEALGELRAARRMGGGPGHLAVMADIERALGRPERAIELTRAPEASELDRSERIELAIVAAGARRDLGELDAAVVGLQLPELEPGRRDPWSARLFYAYADNLAAAGRTDEAVQWFVHATDADDDGDTDAAARLAELTGEPVPDDADDDVAFGEEDVPAAAAAPPTPDVVPPAVEATTPADADDDDTAADDVPPVRAQIPELLPADDVDETPSSVADPVVADAVEASDLEIPEVEIPEVADHEAAAPEADTVPDAAAAPETDVTQR